jgi:hypothetical protein
MKFIAIRFEENICYNFTAQCPMPCMLRRCIVYIWLNFRFLLVSYLLCLSPDFVHNNQLVGCIIFIRLASTLPGAFLWCSVKTDLTPGKKVEEKLQYLYITTKDLDDLL